MQTPYLFAQNEIGPEGYKLFWILLIILLPAIIYLFLPKSLKAKYSKKPLFKRTKIKLDIQKDKLFYPDTLTLTVKNKGNTVVDLTQPLLVFDKFWIKRKFKIKGTGNHHFYPLLLDIGQTHELRIDLNHFYQHDTKLKRFPKIIVQINDVNGNKLGRKAIFVRKTLLKF